MTRKKPPEPQAPAAAPAEAAAPPPEGAKPPQADGPAPGAKHAGGRPSTYTEETGLTICSLLAEGHLLPAICKRDGMPAISTVFGWLGRRPEFAEAYGRARVARCDFYAEESLEIADNATNDWMEREGGGASVNGEHISRSKLRIDARHWLMARLAPGRYGDKLQLSNDPDNPVGDKHLTVVEVKVQLLEGLGLKKVTDGSGG